MCPIRGEWISKLGHIHAVVRYGKVGKTADPHDNMWMNVTDIMLSKRSQTLKRAYCLSPLRKV